MPAGRRITKLLVANRGEIARRVIRAARELGISTVAVYADQDRTALHAGEADESVALGGRSPEATYLAAGKLVEVAHRTGCDAVHPGYGFLAENPEFARACEEAGLTFVGPPARVLALAGDKLAARAEVHAAGVPVLAVAEGDIAQLRRDARAIGWPVLIKAAGGGGGRGMRWVENPADLERLAAEAERESSAAFGDGRIFIERAVRSARHVEFQVLADSAGNTVHLGERECSIQRRHQKLVEESPSPALDAPLRARMESAALGAARAVGFRGAGTVEFLLDADAPGAFFFLEINARIQVEHPVTEVLTGVDLVAWQLRLAQGELIDDDVAGAVPRGHAIECRICAESPPLFLPAVGTIESWVPPAGPRVRFDGGYAQGNAVPAEFDSLLAKVIAHGRDRETARRRMLSALGELEVLGVETNADFLADVLRHDDFRAGTYTTSFISDRMGSWSPPDPGPEVEAIAEAVRTRSRTPGGLDAVPGRPGPWELLSGWAAVREPRTAP